MALTGALPYCSANRLEALCFWGVQGGLLPTTTSPQSLRHVAAGWRCAGMAELTFRRGYGRDCSTPKSSLRGRLHGLVGAAALLSKHMSVRCTTASLYGAKIEM
jgi:hypothetical protein